MKQVSDAYFAGLIDGEGSMWLEKRGKGKSLCPTLEVKMSCKRTIDALFAAYGGNIRFRPAEKEGWKDQWKWRVTSRKAYAVLLRIRPFMLTKAEKADAFMAACLLVPERGRPRRPQKITPPAKGH